MFRKFGLVFLLIIFCSNSSKAVSHAPPPTCAGFLASKVWNFFNSGMGYPDYEQFPEAAPLMIGIPPGISLDWEILEFHIRDLFESPRPMEWTRFLSWPLRRQHRHFGTVLERYVRNVGHRMQVGWSYESKTRKIRVRVQSELGVMIVLDLQEYALSGINYYVCTGIRSYTGWEPSPDEPETVNPLSFVLTP